MDKDILIIILNWNGSSDTINCLKSLQKQTHKDFKIILVDNASDEADFKFLKSNLPPSLEIELIHNKENLGFTRGNNRILEQIINKTEDKYVILLNNDTEVESDWLKSLVKVTVENNADLVSSKMIDFANREIIDNVGLMLVNTGEIMPIGAHENAENYNNIIETFGTSAGACLYSTQMLRDIGIFDEYFETGYEDAELGVRAVLAGYKSIYAPDAIVYHKGSVSINKVRNYKYTLRLQKNISYTYLKLMPWPVILINLPFIILKYAGVTIVSLLIFRWTIIKTLYLSLWELFTKDWWILKQRRAKFLPKVKLSTWQILHKQTFFLSIYLKYFRTFVIGGKKTVLE